ncbi:MAG: rRNA methyltransferase, partial [Burkholderiales bacterium]|nr:rRNA methyltransferase [Burkholderiales bacterium]MBV8657202.1 rRNA methyltransferase [Burkholderiales bacterium]
MHIHEFHQSLADLGAKPCHIGRVSRAWLKGLPFANGRK